MSKLFRFNIVLLLLYLIAFVATFSLMIVTKALLPKRTIFFYFNPNFYVLLATTIVCGLISLKYSIFPKFISRRNASRRLFINAILLFFALTIVKLIFHRTFYGLNTIFIYVLLLYVFNYINLYFYYSYHKVRKFELKKDLDVVVKSERASKKSEIIKNYIGQENLDWIQKFIDTNADHVEIYSTDQDLSISLLAKNSCRAIINLKNINHLTRINKFFETVNDSLSQDGLFIGVVEILETRKRKILKKYWFPFNYIACLFDFIFNRIFPKIKITQDWYFSLSSSNINRPLSKAETFGRLYSCGFEIIDYVEQKNCLWFCVKKKSVPIYDLHPTYGPFVALRRIGKDKKIMLTYKLRTMYPYSEYIQHYVYTKEDYENAGKAKDDFRITLWGKFLRTCWLDELPMFINFFQGSVKLVGIRPLSKTMFDTYPEYLQEKRTKTKPGLIPPYYIDRPKTQEELWLSEEKYLDAYFKNPIKTDFKYFFKAIFSIVIKRTRSK